MKALLKITGLLLTIGLINTVAITQPRRFKQEARLLKTIEGNFKFGQSQYKLLAKRLPAGRFPKTYYQQTDSLETSNSGWWCSGFYPGSLLYLYKETKDHALLAEANRSLKLLKKEQFNKSTHDLGFMMFCSFGNALNIAPQPAYKQILINSAKSLASRFSPKVGCIKSWDSELSDYLVIIDNMMNLELLFWATKTTGDSTYYKVAVTHANTTLKNHFRVDYSSYHVINYNPATGEVQKKRTAQGYADESAWARGQAWGLYGFTVMYRETRDKKYLDQANHIARFILDHPNLPADKIPYWDYNAPGQPGVLRDASAASVTASALLELCQYANGKSSNKYFKAAETIIRNLSANPYIAKSGQNGGFILQHSVGHIPERREVDVPLTYADYYFIESLIRYKQINK